VTISAADPAAFPSDITIAIVTHDSSESLTRVLDAVAATGCPVSRTLVLDVASRDATADIAASCIGDDRVVRLASNDGPNPARNEALRRSTTRFVLVMDADVLLLPETPAALRRAIAGEDVAVSAPLVVYASRPGVIQYAGGGVHYICEAVNRWMDQPVASRGTDARDIGAAPGAALLIDVAKALEVDGFDARYFLGKEDGDFLHRLRIAGYRLREVPDARVLHDNRPRSTWMFEYQIRNRWHFLLRNYEVRTLIVLAPALAVHELLQFGVLVLKGHAGSWLRACRGIAQLLPSLPADRARVRAYRRIGDRHLFSDDPLVVRADVGGASLFKNAYDAWLRGYWRLVRPLISGRHE
jgi:GT2 family glycosyltransferase